MTRKDEVVTVERVLRRHPGACFCFDTKTDALPYEYFTVGLPCAGVPFGRLYGSAPTLDLAYSIALAKVDDALDQRAAA